MCALGHRCICGDLDVLARIQVSAEVETLARLWPRRACEVTQVLGYTCEYLGVWTGSRLRIGAS